MKILISKKCVKNKSEALGITPGLKINQNLWEEVEVNPSDICKYVKEGRIFNPGNTLKNINFKNQQVFFVDIDDGYIENEITKMAFVRYESFSSTEEHKKYRLIFFTNEEVPDKEKRDKIQNWLNYNCNGDKHCKDASRIFYPGLVNSPEVLDGKIIDINSDFNVITEEKTRARIETRKDTKNVSKGLKSINNKEFIDKVVEFAKENNLKDKEMSINAAYEALNKLDLYDLFDVRPGESFNCFFHNDSHPSARIYENDNGIQVYHCFGCEYKTKDLIGLCSMILDCSIFKTLIIICDKLNIKIGSEYQKESRELILSYKFALNNALDSYEILKSYLIRNNCLGLLNVISDYALFNVPYYSYSEDNDMATFYISQARLNTELKNNSIKGAGTCGTKIKKMCRLGLLKLLDFDKLNKQTKEKIDAVVKENKTNGIMSNMKTQYFALPVLTSSLLTQAQNKIISDREAGIKQKGICQAGLVLLEDISKLYPQTKAKIDVEFFTEMDKTIVQNIEKYGIIEKETLCRDIDKKRIYRWNKKDKMKKYDIYLPFFIDKYGLKKYYVNKKNKNNLKIKLKSKQIFYSF